MKFKLSQIFKLQNLLCCIVSSHGVFCDRKHSFQIVAHESCQVGFHNLLQLLLTEGTHLILGLVPEAVSYSQIGKGLSNDASKRWSNETARHRLLAHATHEQVDVVNIAIDSYINI